MLNALRRVISDASGIGDTQDNEQQQQQQQTQDNAAGLSSYQHTAILVQSPLATNTLLPHTIGMEEGEQAAAASSNNNFSANIRGAGGAPLALVHSGRGGEDHTDQLSTSSSLSGSVDDEDNNNNDMDMEETPTTTSNNNAAAAEESNMDFMEITEEPRAAHAVTAAAAAAPSSSSAGIPRSNRQQPQYQRMDSATNSSNEEEEEDRNGAAESSQTSSRDWGWFEDVHISGTEITTSHRPSSGHHRGVAKKKKSSRPSMDDDDDDDDYDNDEAQDLVEPPQVVDEEAAAMAVTAPTYVLEESLSSQRLWKDTAGNRPPQPLEERAFYEKMWAQNFARSQVNYQMPVEVLTASSPISLNPFADGVFEGGSGGSHQMITDYNQFAPAPSSHHQQTNHRGQHHHDAAVVVSDGDTRATTQVLLSQMHDISGDDSKGYQKVPGSKSDGELTVLLRGPNAFGTTVSKSFARSTDNGSAIVGVDTVNISIASYRVVESKKYGKYAQFLVIYREGSIRDTVGVWKRYRDFETLSNKVVQAHEGCAAVIANMSPLAVTEESETEHLPNAITSWRLLKKRKRWYRCLDAGYLSLKVFLLERFLHDILFESSSPKLLRDFVLGPDTDGPF